MKVGRITAVLAAALFCAAFSVRAAQAQDVSPWLPGKLTGSFAVASDYLFGGITQTHHNATAQGSLDWDTGTGVHLQTFASGVNFGDERTMEMELQGRYHGAAGKFEYDAAFIYFWYPGGLKARNHDFWVIYVQGAYDFGVAKVTTNAYFPDVYGRIRESAYFITQVKVPITPSFDLRADGGYFIRPNGQKNVTDWNIGGTWKIPKWFDLDLRYYGCDARFAGNLADNRVIVKVTRSF